MVAAWSAAVVGIVLVLMGGGHLYAVIAAALAQGRSLDYRLVSLIATGGIVAFPGFVNLAVCKWLREGRGWAYATCIASEAACLVYLVLLVLVKARDPASVPNVGSELEAASIVVGAHLVTLVSVRMSLGTRSRATAGRSAV